MFNHMIGFPFDFNTNTAPTADTAMADPYRYTQPCNSDIFLTRCFEFLTRSTGHKAKERQEC